MTEGRRWAELRFPLRCALVPTAATRRLLGTLADQQLRFRLPARRRPGWLWSAAARHGAVAHAVAPAAALARRRPRPDLDRLVALSGGDDALALLRPAATTLFAFRDDRPVVVVKSGGASVAREAAALRRAAPAGVAPTLVHDDGVVTVQGLVPGAPWGPPATAAHRPADLPWDDAWQGLAAGLATLAQVTARRVAAIDAREAVERVLDGDELDADTRSVVAAAWRDIAALEVSVLRHGDLSGQNWLVDDGRFSGIVDWETAEDEGTPGFDVLHAAVSWFEQGVGLHQWSDDIVAASFRHAWQGSPFFREARAAAATSLAAAGVDDRLGEPIQVVFFARRLGRRLLRPDGYALGPSGAAAMMRTVCGH